MSYEKTLKWLNGFQKLGIKPGLNRIRNLMDKLGDPHDKYEVIHVAGTNGKGSVCRFLESMLVSEGYRVGVYTSPHMIDVAERITINKKMIPSGDLVVTLSKIKKVLDDMDDNGDPPSYFEVLTAAAFLYFYHKKVDFAVVETGLGGRYDATNVVKPLLTVITNVSVEHQKILGDKIEEIAFEKAGVIKKGVPVVTAAKGDALKIIKKEAGKKEALIKIVDEKNWERTDCSIKNQNFVVRSDSHSYNVETSLLGGFQGENIAVAVNALEILREKGVSISTRSIIDGVKKTRHRGRMEILDVDPVLLVDGAHNPAGLRGLKKSLKTDFRYDRMVLVLGIMLDKNIADMISTIVPEADIVVLTKPRNKRSSDPLKLKSVIKKQHLNKKVFIKNNVLDALRLAISFTKPKDVLCVTGSLFLVGETINIFEKTIKKNIIYIK